MNDEFSKQTILAVIDNAIKEHVGAHFVDTFEDAFNADPYIIGTYKANEALNQYQGAELNGVFGAINDVNDYFNEIGIETAMQKHLDPEKLADLLAYAEGDYYFTMLLDNLEVDEDATITDELADQARQIIEQMNADHTVDFQWHIHNLDKD